MQDGFVHVSLRQLSVANGKEERQAKLELSVLDTGKVRIRFGLAYSHYSSIIIAGYQSEFSQGKRELSCSYPLLIYPMIFTEPAFSSILSRKSTTDWNRTGISHCQQHCSVR